MPYFRFSLPWNQSTPIGYSVEITLSISDPEFYMVSNGVFLLLFISLCQHHRAFYDIIEYTTRKIGKKESYQSNAYLFGDIVEIHTAAKK